ncbi:MAG: S46 family peptidase [Saprospiraceae bacterium]|nr:S46 family peptidase [Saprospiraceae bacterium]
MTPFRTSKALWILLLMPVFAWAQPAKTGMSGEPDRFDFGKMWTLEQAPFDYFEKTYGFRADDKWVEHIRMSALRFSNYCSASFVSPEGLLMTNHHCSRGEVGAIMKPGEDFDKNGFYAATAAEERRVEGLFVKQLVKIADVTKQVTEAIAKSKTDKETATLRDSTLKALMAQYGKMPEWAGLEIEKVTYYNGGRFSLYGYKRYDDVRLVLIPELALGAFGGDPDNFTFPRYTLDCTFWRVYENGKPVNSLANYFKINPDGVSENEVVFVVGNPGSTERYRTVSQLEYDRDYRYKVQLAWLSNRMKVLEEEYKRNPSHDVQEEIFNLSNSVKAIGGIVKGMHDPELMGRKKAMEEYIKSKSNAYSKGSDYWRQIADAYKTLTPHAAEVTLLAPSPYGGKALLLMHYADAYIKAAESGAGAEDLEALRTQIKETAQGLDKELELELLATLFRELQQFASPNDKYVSELLEKSALATAKDLLGKTDFADADKLEKMLAGKPEKWAKDKDPLLKAGRLLIPAYKEAAGAFGASGPSRRVLEAKVGNEVFQVYGLNIPPDATFTLRLADGLVKGYNYNGTTAPVKTTYFGLYDRYFSNDGKFPWALPERWNNPPAELLRAPLNFVSTNDIIGGNSGSPIINKKGEAVGLVFDGNIESLPGNFIYDPVANRTVSVHAGGIVAALKYIYKADRVVKEMGQ